MAKIRQNPNQGRIPWRERHERWFRWGKHFRYGNPKGFWRSSQNSRFSWIFMDFPHLFSYVCRVWCRWPGCRGVVRLQLLRHGAAREGAEVSVRGHGESVERPPREPHPSAARPWEELGDGRRWPNGGWCVPVGCLLMGPKKTNAPNLLQLIWRLLDSHLREWLRFWFVGGPEAEAPTRVLVLLFPWQNWGHWSVFSLKGWTRTRIGTEKMGRGYPNPWKQKKQNGGHLPKCWAPNGGTNTKARENTIPVDWNGIVRLNTLWVIRPRTQWFAPFHWPFLWVLFPDIPDMVFAALRSLCQKGRPSLAWRHRGSWTWCSSRICVQLPKSTFPNIRTQHFCSSRWELPGCREKGHGHRQIV